MNKAEILALTIGITEVISLDRFVSKKENSDKSYEKDLKAIFNYNHYLQSEPVLTDFIGENAVYENFSSFRLNKKIYFKIDYNGEQNMFSYCEERNKFIGRVRMEHFVNIGLKIKR